jgi:hypothetical protein
MLILPKRKLLINRRRLLVGAAALAAYSALPPDLAQAAVTFPQTPVVNGFGSAQASLTCTFGAGISAGDFVVLAGVFSDNVAGTISLSDGGDTPTVIVAPTHYVLTIGLYVWIAAFFAPTAGTTAFTVTYTGGSPDGGDMFAWVIRGLTSPSVDKNVSATGTGASPASGTTGTLSSATEAAIAFAVNIFSGVNAGGSGWTFDGTGPGINSGGEHQALSSSSAINGQFGSGGSGDWVAYCVTFQGSGGGASCPQTRSLMGVGC